MNKKISIIMPSYNSMYNIDKAIKSVLNQTYSNFELLVVDDFSTDKSVEIVSSISNFDDRVVLFCNKKNKGAANSRNVAIKKATGDYIAFLDTDDIWHPNKLEFQIKAMKKNCCFASHTNYHRIDEEGNHISLVRGKGNVTYKDMLAHNCIGNLTGIYNSKVLGKFYQKNIGHEDYEMWLRILENTDSIGVLEPLASYTVTTNSLSSNKFKSAKWHYNILCNEIGLNKFKSTFYFSHYIVNAIKTRAIKVS